MSGSDAAPSRDDRGVALLSEGLGGPAGHHGRTRWWSPLLVAVVLAGLAVLAGLLGRHGCPDPDTWTDADASASAPCFSSLPASYVGSGGAEGLWPYGDAFGGEDDAGTRYDVGPGHALAGATYLRAGLADLVAPHDAATLDARALRPVGDLPTEDGVAGEARSLLVVTAAVVGAAALALVVAVARYRRRRPWDGALVAVAPVLVIGALVDVALVGVALAVGGLLACRRGRSVVGGLMLGAATTLAWSPWLVVVAVLLTAATGDRSRVLPAAQTGLVAVATWLVVSLPAIVTGPSRWRAGWAAALDADARPGSLRYVVEQATGGLPSYAAVALVVLVLWAAAVLALVRYAPRPPRTEQVALLLVAVGVVLLGSGPEHALLLLPLAVLARPRLGALALWQTTEVVAALVVWWTVAGYLRSGSEDVEGPLVVVTLVRLAAILGLVALVVREVAMPSLDPVRRDALDDSGHGAYGPPPVRPASAAPGQETTTRSNDVAV